MNTARLMSSTLASLAALAAPAQHDASWAGRVNFQVASRFNAFVAKLQFTALQKQEAATKVAGIVSCLNREYWGIDSDSAHCIVEGSWGKGTQTRTPRDVDILFVLPPEVYHRFETRLGNKQSQLLQEVKATIALDYDTTDMRGDGQVVMVSFANGHGVEVVPAFELQNGPYYICNTHGDGSYKTIDPKAEIAAIEASDVSSSRTTRELVKMLKRWQWQCNVGDYLKSFQIELIVVEYLKTVGYSLTTRALYDYLVRDFFKFLIDKQNGYVFVPGTIEIVSLGDAWLSRAQTAYDRAANASELECQEYHYLAADEWQNIFGTDI
jgi:hypothetical protein